MKNFKHAKNRVEFERHGIPPLCKVLESFLGCKVRYTNTPIGTLDVKYSQNFLSNTRRGVYLAGDGHAVLLGRVQDEDHKVVYCFAFELSNLDSENKERLINEVESTLSMEISKQYKLGFKRTGILFGDFFIESVISRFFSRGNYDHRKIFKAIDAIKKISYSKFEGRNFTTGMIITKSHYAFARKGGHDRTGNLFELENKYHIPSGGAVDKRFWYLADGQNSFFLINKNMTAEHLFIIDRTRGDDIGFVDEYTLKNSIKGLDVCLRVVSEGECSVLSASGLDFVYKDGGWKIRDISAMASYILSSVGGAPKFIERFIYYIMYLSRRRLSCILWIPFDGVNVSDIVLSVNSITSNPLSIIDETHTQNIVRLISSDGATIFNTSGEVVSFGSIVDISKINVVGVKGTGETASQYLAENGVAVKVSQDGTIKLNCKDKKELIL